MFGAKSLEKMPKMNGKCLVTGTTQYFKKSRQSEDCQTRNNSLADADFGIDL